MPVQNERVNDPYAKLDGSMFDKIASYIPGISTVNVIINLAQRKLSPGNGDKPTTPYMHYVKNKSGLRLLAEAIPFGNFAGLAKDVRDHFRSKAQYQKVSVEPTLDDLGAPLNDQVKSTAPGGSPTTGKPKHLEEIEMEDYADVPVDSPILRATHTDLQKAIEDGGSELDDDYVENEDDFVEITTEAESEKVSNKEPETRTFILPIGNRDIRFEAIEGTIKNEKIQELRKLRDSVYNGNTESLYQLGMELIDSKSGFQNQLNDALYLFGEAANRQHLPSMLMQAFLTLYKNRGNPNGEALAKAVLETVETQAMKANAKLEADANSVEARTTMANNAKLAADANTILELLKANKLDHDSMLTYLIQRQSEY